MINQIKTRKTRRGSFETRISEPEDIKRKIRNMLGQGEWDISYHKNGVMITYEATSK